MAGQAGAGRAHSRCQQARNASFRGQVRLIFCRWAVRHDLLDASPMDRIDTVEVPRTLPQPTGAGEVAAVLDAICSRRPRKDVPLDVGL